MTVVLKGEAADLLRRIAAEDEAAPEQVVAEALKAFEDSRDPALDSWLREIIVSRAKALEADPTRAVSAKEIRSRLLGDK